MTLYAYKLPVEQFREFFNGFESKMLIPQHFRNKIKIHTKEITINNQYKNTVRLFDL